MNDTPYVPYHPNPSRPRFAVPPGAVDAHCHVFGPADRFPFAVSRKYTPCDAPKERLFALRDHLGFARNVIVQASCHGTDNAALEDALLSAGDKARGVAVIDTAISDSELSRLDLAGVRGVRFNFIRRLVNAAPRDEFVRIATRAADLGWHVVVYFEASDLPDLAQFLRSLPTDVVIDHMGRPNVAAGADSSEFGAILKLMESDKFWVKVSCPERLTVAGPPYSDVVPFAARLVETYPQRVLWGTDWPHPNMVSHMPDDGQLVDIIPQIAPAPQLVRALLIDNPMRLYWAR